MFKPKKTLGQNFLINPRILDQIVTAARINKQDTIVEIGPGLGTLTAKLASKAGKVIAIEKDSRLILILKKNLAVYQNIEIIENDVLKFDAAALSTCGANYKIVANIPYYITSNLLRRVLEKWPRPELIILTIQKEVAQRVIAKPPHMNLLALSVQYYSVPEIIGYVSKSNFRPVPEVDSAIIKLTPRNEYYKPREKGERLFKLIKMGFSGKRKQLINNLTRGLGVKKEILVPIFRELGLKNDIRPENLSLKEWQRLAELI